MSYPTKSVFIHTGTWDDTTRSHPAMKWMESYTKEIDARKWDKPAGQDHVDDFTLTKSTGQIIRGAEAAWKSLANEVYAPFNAHLHYPEFLMVWEEGDGYDMFGIATLYGNLAAPGSEPKVKGKNETEWDVAVPSAFKFHYVKNGDSFKLGSTQIFSDPSAAVVIMLKRGMITAEQLMHM